MYKLLVLNSFQQILIFLFWLFWSHFWDSRCLWTTQVHYFQTFVVNDYSSWPCKLFHKLINIWVRWMCDCIEVVLPWLLCLSVIISATLFLIALSLETKVDSLIVLWRCLVSSDTDEMLIWSSCIRQKFCYTFRLSISLHSSYSINLGSQRSKKRESKKKESHMENVI